MIIKAVPIIPRQIARLSTREEAKSNKVIILNKVTIFYIKYYT